MRTRNTKRSTLYLSLFALAASFVFAREEKGVTKPVKEMDSAVFHVDLEKKEITANAKALKEFLKLSFVSVTTDQPVYWPNEEVFLKILMPASSGRDVDVTVQKKDAGPSKLGRLKMNGDGFLVLPVMSGKTRKLEPGEYRVEVRAADGKLSSYTTFSVVEGALGALSFGFDFAQVTDPRALEKANGAWFMGNAGGVDLSLNGEPVPALGRSGQVIRNLAIPPARRDQDGLGQAPSGTVPPRVVPGASGR